RRRQPGVVFGQAHVARQCRMAYARSEAVEAGRHEGRVELARAVGAEIHEHDRIAVAQDRKSTRLNSSHVKIAYAGFCLKKKRCYSITRPTTTQVFITNTQLRTIEPK